MYTCRYFAGSVVLVHCVRQRVVYYDIIWYVRLWCHHRSYNTIMTLYDDTILCLLGDLGASFSRSKGWGIGTECLIRCTGCSESVERTVTKKKKKNSTTGTAANNVSSPQYYYHIYTVVHYDSVQQGCCTVWTTWAELNAHHGSSHDETSVAKTLSTQPEGT